MKAWQWLAVGVAGIVALKYVPILMAGNNLTILFGSIDFNNSILHLTAQNTTNTAITLNSLAADVTFDTNPAGYTQADSTDLGNVSLFNPVTIQPNAQTDIPLTYSVCILNLLGSAAGFLQNGLPGSINVNVNGTVNVAGITLPLNVTKTVQT